MPRRSRLHTAVDLVLLLIKAVLWLAAITMLAILLAAIVLLYFRC